MSDRFWTPVRTAQAVKLYEQGEPVMWIAEAISAPSGNAVIGKMNRLGVIWGGGGRRHEPYRYRPPVQGELVR